VGANGNEVGVELVNGREGFFAEPLHGVGVKNNSAGTANFPKPGHGLDGADFIVGRHDRNEDGVGADGFGQIVGRNQALGIHGEPGHFKAFFFLEILEAIQDGVVFYAGGDQMPAFAAQFARGAEDGQVVALGAAARSRASSSKARAWRPMWWTLDGFP
jgi:hypothetical protein